MSNHKIIITGATGFCGSHLIQELNRLGRSYSACARGRESEYFVGNDYVACIHLAGRAHVMNETTTDPLSAFRRANVDYALKVARYAVESKVKRFIYVSSIKVNGEETETHPFTELSTPNPLDPYGISKHEAELALSALARETGLEVVIVRPPLIYGAGVRANFARLMQLVTKGLPLPLGAIYNQRSLLYVGNLVDFLILCTHHPKAANQTFLLSDGEDVSTTKLLQMLAKAKGASSRLLPVPASWLNATMRLLGKGDMAQRLLANLQVDSSKAQDLLDWIPPFAFEQGIQESVKTKS